MKRLISELTPFGLLQQYKLAITSADFEMMYLLQEEIYCRMEAAGGE